MATLDELIDEVAGHLPGCPRPAIRLELVRAMAVLCERTQAWREKTTFDQTAGTRIYTLKSRYSADILHVAAVWRRTATDVAAETDTRVKDFDGQRLHETLWSVDVTEDVVKLALKDTPETTVAKGLRAELVLRPVTTQTPDLDPSFLTAHGRGIAGKAIAELAMRARRPWSNPALAPMMMARFRAAISDARTAMETEHSGGAPVLWS